MNIDTKYWFLRGHKFFDVITSSQLKEMASIPNFEIFPKKGDNVFFSHGDEPRVYFLKKGILKIVSIDERGNEVVTDVLQKGDIFGEFTLTDSASEEYAVAVSENVICCSFRMKDFEKIIEQNPQLGLTYTKWMGLRFKKLQNKYSNLMFKDVRTRLKLFLSDWALKEGLQQAEGILVKNYLTHQDIACLVCSTRQTINQLFNELKEEGFLDYSRSEIIIKKAS